MRILIINSVPDSGSTGRICTAIGRSLVALGNDVVIGFGRSDAITDFGKIHGIKIGSKFDLYLHGLRSRFFDDQGLGSEVPTREFLKKMDIYNPDVIWLNNIHGYYINVRLLFNWIKKREAKVFWTLHDCWAFTGHCAYYDFYQCDKWKFGCKKCSYRRSYPKTIISRSSRNYEIKRSLFTGIKDLVLVTPSQWLKNEVSKSFLGKYECRVINNGIDLSSFFPSKNKSTSTQEKIILGVANKWTKEKGLNDFIMLSSMIKKNEKIMLVGEMPSGILLPYNISCVLKTSNLTELRDLYSNADVFFNPTYQDNYPTVNMEAIACNTPVVSYDVGGACEMIDPRFSVKKGDLDQAYNLIETLISGKADYDFSMRDSFSEKRFTDQYLNLFIMNR